MRVVLVRHDDGPDDDRVTRFVAHKGWEVDIRRPFQGDALGEVGDDVAATVVYGGKYNAYDTDQHAFLTEEYRWIDAAMDADIPVLGFCQGAQMIAYQQGKWAGALPDGRCEFGYYEISPVPGQEAFLPQPLHMTQSHYHTFDLPDSATHLARSDAFENQAFRIGDTVYGLQFHPEQTIAGFRRWQSDGNEMYRRPGAQSRPEQDRLAAEHDAAQAAWFLDFLDAFLAKAPL